MVQYAASEPVTMFYQENIVHEAIATGPNFLSPWQIVNFMVWFEFSLRDV